VQEFVGGNYHKIYRSGFSSELASDLSWRNLDRRIRVISNHGLCTIGWDVSQVNYMKPPQVKTFNMYTCEFSTMALPLHNLPRPVEKSAHVWKDDGPLVHQFSLDHDGVGRCADAVCDDDFEILFGDYGYVVWCFDEDIELPVAGSLADELMEVAPAARPLPLNRRPSRPST
jgi:hypothetical protein